jgi:hypothetical protein
LLTFYRLSLFIFTFSSVLFLSDTKVEASSSYWTYTEQRWNDCFLWSDESGSMYDPTCTRGFINITRAYFYAQTDKHTNYAPGEAGTISLTAVDVQNDPTSKTYFSNWCFFNCALGVSADAVILAGCFSWTDSSCSDTKSFTAPFIPGVYTIPLTGAYGTPLSNCFGVDAADYSCVHTSIQITVACPSGQVWNGVSCSAACPTTSGSQTFTSNGSFIVPPDINSVTAVVISGGGGGAGMSGGCGDTAGGGGGGSGGRDVQVLTVTPGQNMSVTVGNGGLAGRNLFCSGWVQGAGDGGRGGNSMFGPISVSGGYGGIGSRGSTEGDLRGIGGSGGTPGGVSGQDGADPGSHRHGFPPAIGGSLTLGYGTGGDGNGEWTNTPPMPGQNGAVILNWCQPTSNTPTVHIEFR